MSEWRDPTNPSDACISHDLKDMDISGNLDEELKFDKVEDV